MGYEFTEKQVMYFNEVFNIDITNVKVVDGVLDGMFGCYNRNTPNTIYVDTSKPMSKAQLAATVTHELTHLVQYEYNHSLTFRSLGEDTWEHFHWDGETTWHLRYMEIDSMLSELYYLYYCNRENEKINDMVTRWILSRFNKFKSDRLFEAVSTLEDEEFKELFHVLQEEQVA